MSASDAAEHRLPDNTNDEPVQEEPARLSASVTSSSTQVAIWVRKFQRTGHLATAWCEMFCLNFGRSRKHKCWKTLESLAGSVDDIRETWFPLHRREFSTSWKCVDRVSRDLRCFGDVKPSTVRNSLTPLDVSKMTAKERSGRYGKEHERCTAVTVSDQRTFSSFVDS